MSDQRKPQISFHEAQGSLPAWFWRSMSDAQRGADGDFPAVVIKDGRRRLTVVDAEDWNPIVDQSEDVR